MDAFEALLQDASSTPAQPTGDPFAALLAQPAGQPKAKPAAPDKPPSFFEDVVVKSGKKLLSDAADVIDFGTVGIPSMVVAGAGEQMTRLQLTVNDLLGVGQKRTRREIAQEGAATAQRLQSGGTPARNLLRTLGWLPEGPGSAEVLMEKVMGPVTKAAEGIEERTKNSAVPVLKEDVLSVVNGLFAAAGVKGAQFAGKRIVGKMEAKAAAAELKAWDAKQQATDAIQAESAKAGEIGVDPTPVKTATNLGNAPILESLTPEALKADKVRRKEVKREMRARFAEDRYDPARPDSPQAEAARVRGQEDRMPAEGQKFEMPRGYGPDPTMDWLRGGAAVGVGLGSLYALSQDNPEVAAAMAAGAFVVKGGKGLTLEAIKTMPDATPLGRILDQSAYTLSSLEMLPRNRFEFGKDSIAQLLKRDSVTKAEREILQGVLDATPGETITAKQLMEGVKARTGDFELKAQQTDQFATYGLANLDRVERDMNSAEAWIPEDATPAEAARLQAEAREAYDKAPIATTTIYQSPVELGTANHFGDPNYFAHTRSFVEDGVKHVVELQSDVAQKAGKVLTEAERAKLAAERDALVERIGASVEWNRRIDTGEATPGARRTILQPLRVELAELEAKLSLAEGVGAISPMLKDWHKRLVREELASSAAKGEPTVRFADADTVAKVEGWPEFRKVADVERDLAYARKQGYSTSALESELKAVQEGARFKPEHQGIYDRYAKDVTKFLKQLGGKHVVDAQGHGWWEVPVEGSKQMPAGRRVQQFGGLDADLAKAVAVIGGGAWIASSLSNPENKARNAAWTAALLGLGLAAKSRISGLEDMAKGAGQRLENTLGNISSEVRDMSPALLRRLTTHAWDELKITQDLTQAIAPYLKALKKAPAAMREELNAAILTGKPGPILAAMGKAGNPALIKEWQAVRQTLATLGKGLIDTGRLKQLLPDYYPRMVIDYPGLLNAIGVEAKGYLESIIDEANKKSLRNTGEGLSPLDISLLVNKHLERAVNGQGKPGFLKQRSIETITADLAPFYAPASESLPLYIRAAVKEIERAKFFGRDLVRYPETALTDLDSSIGNVVLRELQEGRIKEDQIPRLKALLNSRFGPGERASSRGVQAFKNMGNAMLLGNVFSALRNLGDVGPIVALHGALPSVKAAIQLATRKPQRITAADMGMVKHIGEEFVHGTRQPVTFKLPLSERQVQLSTAKFVDATFKLAGWRFLDVGMKELAANAALQKYGRLAKTESGRAALQRSYGDYFGKDFPQLVEDLVGGKKTRLTMELAIREVSDAQPLSKVEMPKYYNDYPDARVLYMLKSFSIKQLNLVRDRGWKEIARGNVKQGTEFLLRYTLLAGLAGMTTDNLINALLGRDTDWDATEIPVHAMKNFGWSQYALDRLKAGRTGEALLAVGAPPIDPFVQVATGNPKAMQYVPLIGKPTYNLGMGGADKANYLKRQREARKERDEADPEAAILRRKRAKEAFEKRVRESAEAQRP